MSFQSRLLLILLAASIVGCARSKEAAKSGRTHTALLTSLYTRASSMLGHDPKDEQEFKATLEKANIPLDALKVSSLDEVFVSERDGQPLVVVYSGKLPNSDVVVYEKAGVDGKRLLGHK